MRILLIGLLLVFLSGIGHAVDLRAVKLLKYLERYPGTPLASHVHEILSCADKFKVDYRLYVAISGAESGFGRKVSLDRKNFTGYLNGRVGFISIYDNIYKTHELIGTGKWYKKYRATKNIKDFVYTYKGVPPYAHYLRNIRAVMVGIANMPVDREKTELEAAANWVATRYDKY
ncbi:hypothetical protein A2276_00440 [candidate division WOR-1 bacterium RIFOXYA12_FULL_43_27]|uniref:Mannosyl-glycoprotein endo-beta-N-acetylglucosamidase-like domain-containing protein n=1 Tax=candidate division WOR-1 bacterium RIFOXYC2_FULL_46_14 TaxID=1802587 RepID=A0A1F4U4J3_UNCSA|nr:MAG: hypothetical protein A2276_00440 [candidate division WOR-1 bacterium RIFOXYA12_FULL_43_27]OGC20837.1 MAG: hypothetical protein A2292_07435 [candidate division WOR-1 bacterium RIFOXYB2_FULL_46_45]OGC31426.1 MAG: hypothetical protein A2232_04015 [candidate division WOR-1 bacterium RIFOXYA2_FULL_46_56]OGC39832.1 MAG: hypothetical protein A2438_04850 [candidate division WOR-1 bacterium RIFOXYC2_FULL_46_14]